MNVNGTVQLDMNGTTLVLPVNPDQQFSQDFRVTIVQTLSGIYSDNFGAGISQIQLSGTTALNSPQGRFNGQPVDGNTAAMHLYRDILLAFSNLDAAGQNPTLNIYDDCFNRSWKVKPIGQLQMTRQSTDPLILKYSQTFVVLQDNLAPYAAQKVTDPVQIIWQSPVSLANYTQTNVTTANTHATSVKQTPNMTYIVQSGDTLWAIAQRYLPSGSNGTAVSNFVNRIVSLNGLKNENLIFPGENLKIPA